MLRTDRREFVETRIRVGHGRPPSGIFAQKALNGVADGVLFGNPGQVVMQLIAVVSAALYSRIVSFIVLKMVGVVFPLRAQDDDQSVGLDLSMHGEEAYVQAGGSQASAA